MTKSVKSNEDSHFPKKMYPDNASNSPYVRRLDNREESLLGTFIQWVDTGKAKKSDKKSADVISKKPPADDSHMDKVEKKTKNDPIKWNRSDHADDRSPSGMAGIREHMNMSRENINLSRPATPQPTAKTKSGAAEQHPDLDKYRIMYLLVRIEQQQEHLRHVHDNMMRLGNSNADVKNIINMQDAITKMHAYLVGVRDNNPVTMRQIGNRTDLEEFLQTVENSCSSIEELPVPGTSDDKMMRLINEMEQVSKKSGIKEAMAQIKLRRRKNTPPSSLDVMMKRLNGPNTLRKEEQEQEIKKKDTHSQDSRLNKNNIIRVEKSKPLKSTGGNLPDIGLDGKQEFEVVTLMKEIDDLMDNSGLVDRKHDMLSYEAIMLGAGEKKHKPAVTKKLAEKPISKHPDVFIQELDKLLDECDMV